MAVFKRPNNSLRMLQMAEKLGVDLDKAIEDGQITPRVLRNAAHLCGECAGSLECKIWFAAQRDEHPDHAPNYCPNGSLYKQLSEG